MKTINSPLRFAIVGAGSIASLHIESLRKLPDAELLAVATSDPQRAQELGRNLQVDYYTDYQKMLVRDDIDVVTICTFSGNHLGPALAAARRGKHVIVEKPLEITVERAQQMIKACREAGVKLCCIFQNRFADDYQKLKRAIRDGKLGKLVMGNAYIKWYRDPDYYASRQWRGTLKGDGGAALINQSIHTIDLLQHLMGPVKKVFGKIKTMMHDIEGEDLGLAILQFQNGALGTIEGSTACYPGYPERLEVYGTKGSVILEGGKVKIWNLTEGTVSESGQGAIMPSGASDPSAIDTSLHLKQIRNMIDAILEDREPVVNGEEGLKSLKIIRAIYESASRGVELKLS